MSRNIRLLDVLIVVFSCLFGVGSLVYAYGGMRDEPQVHVESVDSRWVLPLNQDHTLDVVGPWGTTVVMIARGTVRVLSSPCAEKICVRTGSILRPGAWIACLPNRVLVSIDAREDKLDAVTY